MIIVAVVFLLSGLRLLKFPFPVFGYSVDIAAAFILIVIGMAILYSGVTEDDSSDHHDNHKSDVTVKIDKWY